MTEPLYRDDAYMRECDATVQSVNERGGIILDRTVFYPASGGQPGDSGALAIEGAGDVSIATTVYGPDKTQIVHVPDEGGTLPEPGARVRCRIDWQRRYAHMRLHTCLHLLCSIVDYPVTGGAISADGARLDFDIPAADFATKEELTDALNALIAQNHPVSVRWISDEELTARPDLVRTMSVKPPMGSGRVRLLEINGGEVDLQPCGGTHVAATGEIGGVLIHKIEKKGAKNRRVRVAFARDQAP